MSVTPETDRSVLAGHYAEWEGLTQLACNVLIEGDVTATDAVVRLLLPHVREPVVDLRAPGVLNLPVGETRSLIVRNVAALSMEEQRRLLTWMCDAGANAQVITTAASPVFTLVEAGVFDVALYYRLNVLLLRVTLPVQSGWPHRAGAPRHDRPIPTSP